MFDKSGTAGSSSPLSSHKAWLLVRTLFLGAMQELWFMPKHWERKNINVYSRLSVCCCQYGIRSVRYAPPLTTRKLLRHLNEIKHSIDSNIDFIHFSKFVIKRVSSCTV